MRSHRGALLITGAAVAATVVIAVVPEALWPVRLPAAIALAAVLPGYALAGNSAPSGMLGPAERAMLTVSLSIATTILLALILHATGIGLRPLPWAAAITITTALIAAGATRAGPPVGRRGRAGRPAPLAIALGCLTAALLALAFVIGTRERPLPGDVPGTVALWALPSGPGAITVGVRSAERQAERFVVRTGRGGVVETIATFTLKPGEEWRRPLPAPAGGAAVRVSLARAAAPGVPIRSVRIGPSGRPPIRSVGERPR
ncbi:MAG: DUF1616 domain-containing protein [Baekduia sp.]